MKKSEEMISELRSDSMGHAICLFSKTRQIFECFTIKKDDKETDKIMILQDYSSYKSKKTPAILINDKEGITLIFDGENETKSYHLMKDSPVDKEIVLKLINQYAIDGAFEKRRKHRIIWIFKILKDGVLGTGFEHYNREDFIKFLNSAEKSGNREWSFGHTLENQYYPTGGPEPEKWKLGTSTKEAISFARCFIVDYQSHINK